MNLKDIKALIQLISKSEVYQVDVKLGDLKIRVKNTPPSGEHKDSFKENRDSFEEILTPKPILPKQDSQQEALQEKHLSIRSPMVGTFYIRPSPDEEVFVKVGDQINPETPLCMIESMKIFNRIDSEISGKIVKILVEDASPVEYDQALFLVDPS